MTSGHVTKRIIASLTWNFNDSNHHDAWSSSNARSNEASISRVYETWRTVRKFSVIIFLLYLISFYCIFFTYSLKPFIPHVPFDIVQVRIALLMKFIGTSTWYRCGIFPKFPNGIGLIQCKFPVQNRPNRV